ncbi:MAG: hypothetical protein FWG84_08715 [Bacteroidales bacterium]|nr:hypothetical protein [Bacteroidales bacterium]
MTIFKYNIIFFSTFAELCNRHGRFGVMAAVAPQTILCGNERLYPAGSLVEAAPTPSRWDDVRCAMCNVGSTSRHCERSEAIQKVENLEHR